MTRLLGVAYKHNAYKWIYRGDTEPVVTSCTGGKAQCREGEKGRERGGSLTSSVASNKDFWLLCLLYNANEWFAYFTALLVLSGSRSDLSFHSLVGNIIKPQSHFRSCAGIFSNYEIWENDHRDGKRDTHCSNQFFFSFFVWRGPDISPGRDRWEGDSCRRGGKIGVKSLRAEQVSVICSLGARCQPYNSDLDSPHKRQNSFELHMLHGALQVNPESAVTPRLGPGEGTPHPSPATRLSGWRFIRAVDWWISFE